MTTTAFVWFHNNSDNTPETIGFYESFSAGSPPTTVRERERLDDRIEEENRLP
jgi:hypothetical protein